MGYHDESTLTTKGRLVYMRKSLNKWRRWMKKNGNKAENAVFIGTGVSGVAAASAMSILAKCAWGFVRKEDDIHHHGSSGVTFYTGDRSRSVLTFWIVDDFVDTGETVRNVCDECNQYDIDIQGVICVTDFEHKKHNVNASIPEALVFIDPHNRTFTTGENK